MSKRDNIWRTIIGIVLGMILIFVALKARDRIIASKKQPEVKSEEQITKIYTQRVELTDIPVEIVETGNLEALRTVELYAEVQGILLSNNKLFKPGQSYKEGETILSIDDAEFESSLTAQKSVLYNLVAQIMPDLRLDYPEIFPKWQDYLKWFDIKKPVLDLPEFESEKEKFFINSKNIVTTYYEIKNLEERHKKYNIQAPFYSIVTEAMVHPGALIRSGQHLGTVLNPSVYELTVSVDESYKEYVTIGKKVKLHNLTGNKSWTGRIARMDAAINTTTQGIRIYIEVSGSDLKAGMFLEAKIEGKAIESSFELSRKLLVQNNNVFVVRGDTLALTPVDVAFFKERTAIITNLEEGTTILGNAVPGAYDGMKIEVIE